MYTIVDSILTHGFAEFSYQGSRYLIQQESNKGCHYLSLWRLTPVSTCMCRACFDVFDGISDETVQELFDRPFAEGRTVRDVVQSPEARQWESPASESIPLP